MGVAGRSDSEAVRPRVRMRWIVLGAIFLLSFITIVDRVCISAAKKPMAAELQISDEAFGWVFGVFTLGYALMMVPSGWLADRFGPGKFLAVIVVLWSVCTLGTGLATALVPLLAIRFAFGLAEAGAYPAASRAIYNWFPIGERGVALGLLNTGGRLGAAFGLPLMSLCIAWVGWRTSYYLLAVVGFAWAIVWVLGFRDRPRGAAGAAAEGQGGGAAAAVAAPAARLSWRHFVRSRNVPLILLPYFAASFGYFLCYSWLLPYTKERFGLTDAEAGFCAAIPLCCGALATWLSGVVVDAIYRRGRWRLSRVLPASAGLAISAVCLVLAPSATSVGGFIACFAVATFGLDAMLSPSWTVCSDVGRRYTGTLSGAMNTMGSLGALACSVAFPWLLGATGSIHAFFYLAAAMNVLGLACWAFLRPDRPLVPDEAEPPSP